MNKKTGELERVQSDLKELQFDLKTITRELETAQSALEKQANAQAPQWLCETRSIVGPMEQVNLEPSYAYPAANSFTFVAAQELPSSQIGSRQIRPKRSQRQPRTPLQRKPQPQSKQESEPEPKPPLQSQLGIFSHHLYPQVLANRPRRSHVHAGEAIRKHLHLPLEKVHTIVSKLDKIGDRQEGMAAKAGLIISAELTGLSIEDIKFMQSLRWTSVPGSSRNPPSIMRAAQLEIPRTLVDLLATDDRPAISAFLNEASSLQSQATKAVTRGTKSRGTQTETSDAEAEGNKKNKAVQEDLAIVQPMSHWKVLIFLCLLGLILALLLPSHWSSPVAWFFKDPDPNSGWLDYVPEQSRWSNTLPTFSSWPIISNIFFDRPDLESKWCGDIPMG